MTYLLDTHTVLWLLDDSEKLSEQAAAIIENHTGQNDIAVSATSLWEFTVKHNLGKLRFEGGIAALYTMIEATGWNVLPISQSHLEKLAHLPFLHRDPFDRLLVAAAQSDGMTLVTADENIHNYEVIWAW